MRWYLVMGMIHALVFVSFGAWFLHIGARRLAKTFFALGLCFAIGGFLQQTDLWQPVLDGGSQKIAHWLGGLLEQLIDKAFGSASAEP